VTTLIEATVPAVTVSCTGKALLEDPTASLASTVTVAVPELEA